MKFQEIYLKMCIVMKLDLFEPRVVFKDRTLLDHITKRFPAGFRDYKLEDKVMKFWSDKNLPKTNITLDSNTVKTYLQNHYQK